MKAKKIQTGTDFVRICNWDLLLQVMFCGAKFDGATYPIAVGDTLRFVSFGTHFTSSVLVSSCNLLFDFTNIYIFLNICRTAPSTVASGAENWTRNS